ncbi:hypothetical protein AF332_11885 [Sporosarcina globispora]|uniref:Uncharacterized protein n=1 Tax=Sporosarcina globispora TaxID=1459 RepID=A0A0M0GCA6_SPOGL|nr:hypothetical protein [Sporosarcina globispora]KON87459.1 hypothetical protein AF332_11885 [Sporosarcina globispora]
MKEVKCTWCKTKDKKEEMKVEEKGTGKFNKNGTEKMVRKYFHKECEIEFIKDKEMKKKELVELDLLYSFLRDLHKIQFLDGRMMEKIQDLRNGTIKIDGRKINKYKQGVTYSLMLETYQYIQQKIDFILNSNQFKEKWNEFSYIFGTMVRNINTVQEAENRRVITEKINRNIKVDKETVEIEVKKTQKKDDLDISDFL